MIVHLFTIQSPLAEKYILHCWKSNDSMIQLIQLRWFNWRKICTYFYQITVHTCKFSKLWRQVKRSCKIRSICKIKELSISLALFKLDQKVVTNKKLDDFELHSNCKSYMSKWGEACLIHVFTFHQLSVHHL